MWLDLDLEYPIASGHTAAVLLLEFGLFALVYECKCSLLNLRVVTKAPRICQSWFCLPDRVRTECCPGGMKAEVVQYHYLHGPCIARLLANA